MSCYKNNLKVCEKCGTVLTKKVQEPNKVVIVIKVICKECKKNETDKQTRP